jgi:hypothetical protein
MGIEMAVAALTAGASLFAASKSPKPPKVENPATPAPTARAPGAVVRVGGDSATEQDTTTPDYSILPEKRVSGKALGGLGKGGLGL